MSLRKSPVRTPAFLAAQRRNTRKCAGPKTPVGKLVSSVNALKHGRYAHRLPKKLRAAGFHSAAGVFESLRKEFSPTFQPESAAEVMLHEWLANIRTCATWRTKARAKR